MYDANYFYGNPGTKGITEVERDTLLDELDAMAYFLDYNGSWDEDGSWTVDADETEAFVGAHLENVKAVVANAQAAVKAATTSYAANVAFSAAKKAIQDEDNYAELTTKLLNEYGTSTNAFTALPSFVMETAGVYNLQGLNYYFSANDAIAPLKSNGASSPYDVVVNDEVVLKWFFKNGFETKSQIESAGAKTAFRAAAVLVDDDTTAVANHIYVTNVEKLNGQGMLARYEFEGLVKAYTEVKITDFDAVYNAVKAVKDFEDVWGTAPYGTYAGVTIGSSAITEDTVDEVMDATLNTALNYYVLQNFNADYKAIKADGVAKAVTNKDKIVALAKTVKEFQNKYDVSCGIELTNELAAIDAAGVAPVNTAWTLLNVQDAKSLRAADLENFNAFADAFDAYKAEYYTNNPVFKNNKCTLSTDLATVEAYILAGKFNFKAMDLDDKADTDALQSKLNNATVKVTTVKDGKKVTVNAKLDATSLSYLYANGGFTTVEYKFYHKAPGKAYKLTKAKNVNYITYSKSLKKGKNSFRVGVVLKDAKGNVVAEKSYKASTLGYRTIK